ncbi:unnamed protein product [Discula destructiva]
MDATPPSIPRHGPHDHAFHHPRRRHYHQSQGPSSPVHPSAISRSHARNQSVAPAPPELISCLITSLSVVSRPTTDELHSDRDRDRDLDPPISPKSPDDPPAARRMGSFGVEYGAFSKPSSVDLHDHSSDFDDLAAAPPVIKTAKPPSGYSSITAPKSPPGGGGGGGLRSFLSGGRISSRPSSRGSSASRDADVQSVGNVSVERGLTPASSPTELRIQRSTDSWGRKSTQTHSRLMYMTSKERLNTEERARGSSGDYTCGLLSSAMARSVGRSDSFLGETRIDEEPMSLDDILEGRRPGSDGHMSPQSIPVRDSSLRKTGANSRRSSLRADRLSRRNSSNNGAILEESSDTALSKSAQNGETIRVSRRASYRDGESSRPQRNSRTERGGDGLLDASWATTSKANRYFDHYVTDTEVDGDDCAPAPSIAQGKSSDREMSMDRNSKRLSGLVAPELRTKRSLSKLKRRSGAVSPQSKDDMSVPYARPPSADSIDDTVEVYMRSPRLSQKIKHPQTGRVISFSEVGDAEGSAVFCCVGMGLTRFITAFYDELALTLKLRLITPDRPGVGDSEAYADGTATPLSWPDDIYAICQHLKITKFSMLAHSAGAIYALATALRMPQHIRGRIHLLAPWIPPSQMSVFGASAQAPLPPTNAIPTSQKLLRALPTPFLRAANSSFMTATSSSITSSLPRQKKAKRKPSGKDAKNGDRPHLDKANLNNASKNTSDMPACTHGMDPSEEMDQIRPEGAYATGLLSSPSLGQRQSGDRTSTLSKEDTLIAAAAAALADKQRQVTYDTRLTHKIWEVATTGANPAVDLLVCLERRHTIGFRYVDITRPVVIHHGSRDTRVPVENVKWLGKTMRRCEVRVLEGEGHGLMASAAVMGTVLMEISKEWEDWNKVTGQTIMGGR